MGDGDGRAMTFQATPAEAFAALRQAAERTGLQFLSGDAEAGTSVFTAGMTVMTFGEKVTARITPVAPGAVQVTLSSDLQFGLRGAVGRTRPETAADRMSAVLAELLPRAG